MKVCTIQNPKLKWALITTGSLVLLGAFSYFFLHGILLLSGRESIDSIQDLGFGDFSNVLSGDSDDGIRLLDQQSKSRSLSFPQHDAALGTQHWWQ